MANIRTIYENLIDLAGCAISATSEETTLPAENVAHVLRTLVWRATGDASETITFDLGQGYTVDSVALISHNFTSAATITYQSSNVSDFSVLVTNQALTWREGIIFGFVTSANVRYHRFTIADAANPDTYVEIGRIFIGEHYSPEKNFHLDYTTGKIDLSAVTEAEEGNYFSDEKSKRRKINLGWKSPISINLTEREKFEAFWEHVGRTKDFILFLDHENKPSWAYYGRIRTDVQFRNVRYGNWYEVSLDFQEAI